jgi:hypothetical protein
LPSITWDSCSRAHARSGTAKSQVEGMGPKKTKNPRGGVGTPGWWGWKLCLDHYWITMTVGLARRPWKILEL